MGLSASVSNTNPTNRLCFAGLTIRSGFYSLFSVTEEPFVTSGGLSTIQYQFMYLIKLRRSMDGFLLEGQEGSALCSSRCTERCNRRPVDHLPNGIARACTYTPAFRLHAVLGLLDHLHAASPRRQRFPGRQTVVKAHQDSWVSEAISSGNTADGSSRAQSTPYSFARASA